MQPMMAHWFLFLYTWFFPQCLITVIVQDRMHPAAYGTIQQLVASSEESLLDDGTRHNSDDKAMDDLWRFPFVNSVSCWRP